MGRYIFRLPDIGEGIAQAEIVAWHVKVGDRVEEDGPLADLMTDKATVEMESPVSGIVREVAGEAGDTIAIGAPLVVIETEGDEGADENAGGGEASAPQVPTSPPPAAEPESTAASAVPAPLESSPGRYVFRLPDIGEGIAQAEIVAWHVKVGDRVEEDGPLADLMTDKATVEMESPVAGIVREVAGEAGDTIAIGAPLVVIETEGGVAEATPQPAAAISPPPARADLSAQASRPGPARSAASGGKALASPAVRARASALGIDLAAVPAGPGKVVRHEDLDAFLTARAALQAGPAKPAEDRRPVEILTGAGEQVKVIGLRRRIAENMAAAKRHIPHFSYVEECDVTALETLRGELNALRGERPKLTLLPFLITAICRALPDFPMINARYDDAAGIVTRYDSVHLGVAAQTPAGLMVPVIRDAQGLGLWALAGEISRLAQAARDGSAKSDELSGSTLTVTSLGPLGGIATTPVINRPEVAIIGPNRIVERPVFVPDGQGGERIEKRKLMNISISCDHRVVDGWDAASFVQAVRRLVEAPMLLLA